MNDNTHTIKRLITGLALAISLAALTVPSALAGGASRYGAPDGWYPYAVSLTKASTTSRYGPLDPWALAYFASHAKPSTAVIDGRSPDTRDAAQVAQQRALVPVDGRSPDTLDAAIQAHTPVATVTLSPGFDWGDFGIGAAAAFGAMLLLGMSMRLLTARQSRKQPSPVATS